MEYFINKINGMFRVCTDMVKTDPKDIYQENIDREYNLALSNVLKLLKHKEDCDHDWFHIKDELKGNWNLCKKCKNWERLI